MVKKVKDDCPIAPVVGHFRRGDADGKVVAAIPDVPCEDWDNDAKVCLKFMKFGSSHGINTLIRDVLHEQGRS